jgi:hypothetical protein
MGRTTFALLLSGCIAICAVKGLAQAQTPSEQTPAPEQKADQNRAPGSSSSGAPSTPGTITTESPFDPFQEFSAIQNGGPLPGMNEDRYIYRSGKLMRTQGDAGVPNYFVTNFDTRKTYAQAASGCLEIGAPHTRSFPVYLSGHGITYEHIPVGEETVDGHECHVEDVFVHNPRNPVLMHFRVYEAEDLKGFPIKIENRRPKPNTQWVITYSNVVLADQDPSLFVIPNKCQSSAGFVKMGTGAKPTPTSKTAPTPKTAPAQKPQ